MIIDKSKLRMGVWYEDEHGNVIPSMKDSPEPVTKVGARTYHSCYPLEITEHLYAYHDEKEKESCKHKRKWLRKDHGLIKGLKGRICTHCGCNQTRKWWQPWGSQWDEGSSISHMVDFHTTIGGGNQDVILAMANSGDYTLAEALVVWSQSCERCMNVLAYKYMNGKDGYPEYSDEWKRCNTECSFCKKPEVKA